MAVPYHIFAILTDYIREAMRLAHYELMENGSFFATIPLLKGLWAEDATLEACREELQSTLEDRIMVKVRFGDKDFPALNGIDLNPKPEYAQAD
jgi:predicted RNase H-like HicB family nuclease